MTGLVQTSSEETKQWHTPPLIVIRDSFWLASRRADAYPTLADVFINVYIFDTLFLSTQILCNAYIAYLHWLVAGPMSLSGGLLTHFKICVLLITQILQ